MPPRAGESYAEWRRRLGAELHDCEVCGNSFWVPAAQRRIKGGGRFCSRPCKYQGSTAHKQRRGPRVTRHSHGYLLEWAPDHPRSSHGRVLQHILVAEAMLCRPLAADEEIHHRNERREDNRPANLEICKTGEHQRRHAADPAVRRRLAAQGRRSMERARRDPKTGRLLPRK